MIILILIILEFIEMKAIEFKKFDSFEIQTL